MRRRLSLIMLVHACLLAAAMSQTQPASEPAEIRYGSATYPVYPRTCDEQPGIVSPYITAGGQMVTVMDKDGKFVIVPVTMTNTIPPIPFTGRKVGIAEQLVVDAKDFPVFAKTGLHSEKELDRTTAITGKPVAQLTETARPKMASRIGFMAADEDILSVLKGDNRLVQRMGLRHPQLAEPLFHVCNLILKEIETGRGKPWDDIQQLLYNGRTIRFAWVHQAKGCQESIFNDEIIGSMDIHLYRELEAAEKAFLQKSYPGLNEQQWAELVTRLSHIRTGEMQPYYVMRYGFYEGHTEYRVDPIAVAFVFGLRDLREIEAAFPGRLHAILTTHFTEKALPAALRLDVEEVLRIAGEFAQRQRSEFEVFDPKFYPRPGVTYRCRTNKWFVGYIREPNRWPGDHFGVMVDDSTGQCEYQGGA